MTPDKKYSVFVSSTFRDLRKPRDTVMRALLRMNCIPEGMELFVAGSQSQWETIRNTIDKCDCCVVIVGGRYGTIVLDAIARNPDGVSYTEMEYRHAKARGIPVLAFLHEKPESLLVGGKGGDGETDEKREKLLKFRSVLEAETTAAYWGKSPLQTELHACLHSRLAESGQPGWVRGDSVQAVMLPTGSAPQEIPAMSELDRFDDLVLSAICRSLIEDGAHSTKFIHFKDKTRAVIESLKNEHTEEKVVGALERLSHRGLVGEFVPHLQGRHEPRGITIVGAAKFFERHCDRQQMNSLRVEVAKFIRDKGHYIMRGPELYKKFRAYPAMQVDCIVVEIRDMGGLEIDYMNMGVEIIGIYKQVIGVIDKYIDLHSANA